MSGQDELPLFGPPADVERAVEPEAHARRSDPETSHEAARSVDKIRESQEAILAVFREHGRPMTDDELLRRYRASHAHDRPQSDSGIRTRRSELVEANRLVDTGQRVRLSSGRRAIVWSLPDA